MPDEPDQILCRCCSAPWKFEADGCLRDQVAALARALFDVLRQRTGSGDKVEDLLHRENPPLLSLAEKLTRGLL